MFRRRRPWPPLTILAAVAAIAGLSIAAAREASSAPAEIAPATTTFAQPPSGPVDVTEPPDADQGADATTPLFASVGGVYLRLPADDVVVVGFHEAATREPLALSPLGTVLDHQNTTKFETPAPDDDGTPYVVLSSRGRPMPATSAADLVVPEGVAVRAPVDGEVVDVRDYHLYGKHLDQRIEIAPAANPDLRLVMIHVDGVVVEPGDVLVAGETVVATQARRFGFSSHIDRYTEPDRHGHVHLEVKPAPTAQPGEESLAVGSRG